MKAIIGNAVGSVFAVAVVTAAYYAWRLPQRWGALAVLVAYVVSALLLLGGAFVCLRLFVRRDYRRHHLEDKTLLEELASYKEYAARVRYRLLPGVW